MERNVSGNEKREADMRRLVMALAAATTMLVGTESQAETVYYSIDTGGETFSGQIDGLSYNGYDQHATDVTINYDPTEPGENFVITPLSPPVDVFATSTVIDNSFNVVNGIVTFVDFYALDLNVYDLEFLSSIQTYGFGDGIISGEGGLCYFVCAESVSTIPFSPIPAPTPLPAALPLVATGLGVVGWLSRRRTKKDAASSSS